ncbi:C-Jun-amino-terminal kinase-interacting protein 4 isoform X2 [Brienomyrus brachyistius]|uniref:C-Jun-amino-terminal kinase-interacting protein 4 isoform X2 n=1 Tax=Brienomyrus brachyistius TaxID=42636 RepID=UPI0020B1D121|nr:C-Jun-amino-terminal kinase-interacting protein 4 isoform X2 [Brienomyrus brachyistius]
MEFSESILCAAGDLELDPEIVSEEAGKVYSELQSVIEAHGPEAVEPLVPILVWVLEGLASCRVQLKESEEEAEREKGERKELLERFQSERALRKESQERYLELDDQFEQERRAMRGREKEREQRERELERKAREQADQLVALEEQKSILARDLSTLKHTHNKLLHSYRDLLERRRDSERGDGSLSPRSPLGHSKPSEASVLQMKSRVETPPDRRPLEALNPEDRRAGEDGEAGAASFLEAIINSTPELAEVDRLAEASGAEPGNVSDLRMEHEASGQANGDVGRNDGEEEEEDDDDGESLEWELRNTDSVFSELSELSQDYVESVDRGASVRGSADQQEGILSQYEELKRTNELIDGARRALISRVEELTSERASLSCELASYREAVMRLEGKVKELEEDVKRLHKELEQNPGEDSESSLPGTGRRFSRSEMARVVMEKNQYKERLFELQESIRRSQAHRPSKEDRSVEERRTGVWRRFNRLFGLTKDPFPPPPGLLGGPPSAMAEQRLSPLQSHRQQLAVTQTQTDAPDSTLSPRVRRKELYRDIRSHVWSTLGKRQIHGWSMPIPQPSSQVGNGAPPSEPKDVPILVQLRLLDQRDASAKLTCAAAVTPEISGDPMCSVWVMSGPASSSDVTVIDPTRSNTVLDQFSLPPTSPALCLCAVPPAEGDSSGTVWIGTQDGSILVHSASTARRSCLQSVSLSEGVHSLTYFQGHVIAGLANGSLCFFSRNSGDWDLQSREMLVLGSSPVQPLRCVLGRGDRLWVGYWNQIHVVAIEGRKVEHTFSVSEHHEQQVRFLCSAACGVWAACRLDSTLRLFDWASCRPLQEVDLAQLVTKTLGPAFLSLSPLQISSLSVICGRLWVGTGSGAIFSIPMLLSSEASIPYCTLAGAQLCYHGHRQAVKFIISTPGCLNLPSTGGSSISTSRLILSGGEGYINFRIGDDGSDSLPEAVPQRSERSHMIIWQSSSPLLPSPAL